MRTSKNTQKTSDKEVPHIDEDIYSLFQTFVRSFNVIHEMNEYYSIINNEMFYNEGISKDLNLRRDFQMFLKNEKIKRRKKKEEQKNQSGKININKKIEEEKEKNKKKKKIKSNSMRILMMTKKKKKKKKKKKTMMNI